MRRLLVAVSLLLLGVGPNILGGGSGNMGGFDSVVNLSAGTAAEATASLRAKLQPMEAGDDATPNILIRGEISLTYADLTTARVRVDGVNGDAPYKTWFEMAPSEEFEDDLPVADGTTITTTIRGHIHFENVVVNYSCTGQEPGGIPAVLFHIGQGTLSGHTAGAVSTSGGYFGRGPDMTGVIYLRLTGDCDGTTSQVVAFRRDPTTLFNRNTVTVGFWVDGINYSNQENLSLHIENTSGSDHDDIGFWANGVGSNAWGSIRVQNMARGILFTGSVLSDFNKINMVGNDVDIMFGDLYTDGLYGCDVVYDSGCVASGGICTAGSVNVGKSCANNGQCPGSTCTTIATRCDVAHDACDDVRVWGGTAEGGDIEILAHGLGNAVNISGLHVEGSAVGLTNHIAVIAGAGVCSNAATPGEQVFAATVGDCTNGGTLVCDSQPDSFDIRFFGGNLPGENDIGDNLTSGADISNTDWGGTVIGGCAAQASGRINMGGSVADSTIGLCTGGSNFGSRCEVDADCNSGACDPRSVAFDWAKAELTTNNMPIIDITNVQRTGDFFWPNYRQLRHAGAFSIPFQMNITSGFDPASANNYLPIGVWNGTAGVASTDLTAGIPIPWAKVLRYQFHKLECGAHTAHANNTALDFIPVAFRQYDQSGVDAATVQANTTQLGTGSAIAVNTVFANAAGNAPNGIFVPDASLEIIPGSPQFHTKIGVKVTGTGDEIRESCVLTILPLK